MSLLTASIFIFSLVLIITLMQYGTLAFFLYRLRNKEWNDPQVPYTPKTALILTLRGVDPFLEENIERSLHLDYPDYTVFLVVDDVTDPALKVAQSVLERHAHSVPGIGIEIVVVTEHSDTCSLKCNSLVHTILKLDASYEVIVTLDSDVHVHPQWLRQLVEPLSDPRFAAACGQRWYVPEHLTWGSQVRYLWNAAVIVQMVLQRMAWGGSLSIRREVFTQGGQTEVWKHSLSDDVTLFRGLRQIGKKITFVPDLVMVNREICSLNAFYPWMKRQLLMGKLYHPLWNMVIAQSFFLTVPLLVSLGLLVTGVIFGPWHTVAFSAAALGVYSLGVLLALLWMENGVRKKLRERPEQVPPCTMEFILKTLLGIPLTQIVYSLGIIGVYLLRRISWRGVWYTLEPRGMSHMEKYIPYAQCVTTSANVPSKEDGEHGKPNSILN